MNWYHFQFWFRPDGMNGVNQVIIHMNSLGHDVEEAGEKAKKYLKSIMRGGTIQRSWREKFRASPSGAKPVPVSAVLRWNLDSLKSTLCVVMCPQGHLYLLDKIWYALESTLYNLMCS